VLGLGFFLVIIIKKLYYYYYYYYYYFNLLAGSGLRSLGMPIVRRACIGINGIPGKMSWDEKLLYILRKTNTCMLNN